ncbi:MAG: DUF481 domain-containing protein [Myxococcales bacterium]|nr:DUF481 domain-containing protein [Myxococcales bacterium]
MRILASTRVVIASLLALGAVALAPGAFAQDAPVQHSEDFAEPPANNDETVLDVSLGGILSTGNTQSWGLNAGDRFRLVRCSHAFEETFAIAYGQANLPDDAVDEFKDTVRNINAKLRYDFFLTEMDSLFLAAVYRWDTFAGLDTRLQGQVGYMRNIFLEEAHRGWAELGYDITYDNYDPDPLPDPANPAGPPLDGDAVVHSIRGFVGYDNHINENLTYLMGFEGLFNVEDAADIRLNWDNALRTMLVGRLQMEAKFSLKWDNVPVPGAKPLDTVTQLNLIYSFL